MAFGVALSLHPVSSQATGEVVGQLLETVGSHADLVVVLATPGHRGALEDVVATVRHLLSPVVLLAAVTSGLGAGEELVERGPGLVVWSGTCGPVAPVGAGVHRRPAFDPTGAFVLHHPGVPSGDPVIPSRGPDVPICGPGVPSDFPGGPILSGAVDGPVILDGGDPGPGPVGVVFGAGSGFEASVAHGLRPLGPPMVVTWGDGAMVYELDRHPALRRLTDVARDGMPAAELATLAARLYLQVTGPGPGSPDDRTRPGPAVGPGEAARPQAPDPLVPGPEPVRVLGVDRANGALAMGDPVATGATVQFALSDATTVRAAVGRSMAVGSAGAVILVPAGGGRLLAGDPGAARPTGSGSDGGSGFDGGWPDGPLLDGFVEAGPGLPAATLICETAPLRAAAPARSAGVARVQVASFSPTVWPTGGATQAFIFSPTDPG